ncbi:MAG TPA: type II toxin-antitoxin system VapB family antitoxin [Bacillota bacterium]|nr:type II toxin-antitoxin system VapB family antitoxin [Bacillota bacterium]HOL16700.1 type II toxin-antitoxin system VapB family antitoxin [Bacillota bacterium]
MDIAKIFKNGRSQAVRLPKEYRFEGSEVYIKKIGEIVLLIPKEKAWLALEAGIDYFSKDFMQQREQPGPEPGSDFD